MERMPQREGGREGLRQRGRRGREGGGDTKRKGRV